MRYWSHPTALLKAIPCLNVVIEEHAQPLSYPKLMADIEKNLLGTLAILKKGIVDYLACFILLPFS